MHYQESAVGFSIDSRCGPGGEYRALPSLRIIASTDETTIEIADTRSEANTGRPAVSAGQSDTQTFLIWSTAVTSNSSIMPRI